MKTSSIFFAFIFSVLATSCCHNKNTCKQQENNSSVGTTPEDKTDTAAYLNFEAYYYHTAEATYEEVSIKNGKATFTYFKDDKNKCAKWYASTPCWTQNDLTAKETTLDKKEIDSLILLITKIGFMKLDTVIGNPAETERYYSFSLMFNAGGEKKNVLFKSVPGGVTMPDAFRKPRDYMTKVIKNKIGYH